MQAGALWLLSPGILAGFEVGSGHVHDVSFWVLTAVLNGFFYSAVVYGILGIRKSLRSKTAIH